MAIAVKEAPPPADLIACPVAPEGFPTDESATMSAPVRAAAIRLAESYRAVVDQLERLIGWTVPDHPCADAEAR